MFPKNNNESLSSIRDKTKLCCRSAFFLFCADYRAELKQANPSWSIGEIAKELGRRWAEATPDVKKKYADKGEKEKEKYNKVRQYF